MHATTHTEQLSEKVQAKLRKLQALAERGVGGEKETARRMLEKLLARHGLTIEDLATERREVRWFSAPTRFDSRLAAQIMAKVCDSHDVDVYSHPARRKHVGVEVTPAEAIEFELHYEILRTALRTHFEDAYSAFVCANRIYPATPREDAPQGLNERDLRVMAMAAATPATEIRQRLGHSKETGND